MAKITYITNDNKNHTIEVQNGLTVMEGAVQNDIPGIDADCGGGMACATCHVYVKEDWFNKLPKKEDGEEDMLDMAFEPKQNSRLSCQLTTKSTILFWFKCHIQHIFFTVFFFWKFIKPIFFDINMASSTSHSSTTISVDTWYIVLDCSFHNCKSILNLNSMIFIVVSYVSNFCH